MARDSGPRFDPYEILRTLVRHDVRFVVIGGVAGNLHGSATLTRDLDVVHSRERGNLHRLATALANLDARRRDVPPDIRAPIDERAILNGTNFLLTTRYGALDCIGETPAERLTYEQLAPTAVRFPVEKDLVVPAVSLPDLIRMKRATGRDRDRIEVERLTALRDERELQEGAGRYLAATSRSPRSRARAPRPRAAPARSRTRGGRARSRGTRPR